MGLSEEEAYEILELPHNSSYHTVLKSYKRLSLYWFPDRHNFSPTALEKFQKISLAIMKLSIPDRDICYSLTVTDMLLLFQQIFFGGDKCNFSDSDETSRGKKSENSDKNQKQGQQAVPVTEQNEIFDEQNVMMKRRRKAEKRKAEKKRKKERQKFEKTSSKQRDDEEDAFSISSKNSTEKYEIGNKKGVLFSGNKQHCNLSGDYNFDYDADMDDCSGTFSDDDYYYGSDYFGTDDEYVDTENYFDPDDFVSSLFQEIGAASFAKRADKNALALIIEEERKKKKVEQRKAQKKKRKEKKRLGKSTEKEQNEDNEDEIIPATERIAVNDKENFCGSEEDIDLSSAFVTVIAKKKGKHLKTKHLSENSSERKKSSNQMKVTKENSLPDNDSRQYAIQGNEMASIGNYEEAAKLFTQAITLDISDYRYYGNRSYCYERLGEHRRALKDAEVAIGLFPEWAKGHFRKGKALVGLKEYIEAERCFKEVLLLDPVCSDAETEIFKTNVLQVMEKGFSKGQAEIAVERSDSVHSALDFLLSEDFSKVQMNKEADIFVSDCDSDNDCLISSTKHEKLEPYNPEGQTAIWIGNVQEETTEELLSSIFSPYGKIKNVKKMPVKKIPGKFCAFVNYYDRTAAQKAMDALQGIELHGANLVIRFPKKAGETAQEECYFWRTTGCAYPDSCRFKHIEENKGIDKKKSQ